MATEIVLPKFGNTVEECIIKQWNKNVGDLVAVDEVLCEVETDKTTMDVLSTDAGVLRHIFYATGDVVKVMQVIALIGAADENIDTLISHDGDDILPSNTADADVGEMAKEATDTIHHNVPEHDIHSSAKNDIEFTLTPRAKRYLEKKNLTVPQFLHHFPIGSFLKVSQSVIEEKDLITFFAERTSISPQAFKVLKERETALTINRGSGIGGRILERDLVSLQKNQVSDVPAKSVVVVQGMEQTKEKKLSPMTRMRKIISDKMLQSLHTTAQVTLTMQADAMSIKQARKYYKQEGLSTTINDIILYIVSRVLRDNHWANSLLVEDTRIEYSDVNLGCAVQTSKGLMVPVIAQASEKNVHDISSEIQHLADECKNGKISPKFLQGATFTVSNLGSFGVQSFTPILHAPQTGILGLGGIDIKAVEKSDGEFCFKPCLNLSLTFDHRAYDGADAALLLKEFANGIADFEREKA